MASYVISPRVIEDLKSEGLPDSIIDELEDELLNNDFLNTLSFENALPGGLTNEQKAMIINHARTRFLYEITNASTTNFEIDFSVENLPDNVEAPPLMTLEPGEIAVLTNVPEQAKVIVSQILPNGVEGVEGTIIIQFDKSAGSPFEFSFVNKAEPITTGNDKIPNSN